LFDALDLWNHFSFAVELEVLSDALRAKQLDAFDAKMPYDFVGMSLAVVVMKLGNCISDCAGGGQEGSGVRVRIGRRGVETRIFFI
jgi:hypothetical protein